MFEIICNPFSSKKYSQNPESLYFALRRGQKLFLILLVLKVECTRSYVSKIQYTKCVDMVIIHSHNSPCGVAFCNKLATREIASGFMCDNGN
jgi:hypothetical protein